MSDDPEASKVIKAFAASSQQWIIAVQMVAEGVDIPRLAVGVYASRVRTQMFFIQVVGRFVRMRGEEDETTARVFIPSIEPLLSYARDIEKTVDAVLADEEKRVRESQEGDDDPDEPPSLIPTIEVIGSSTARHHATIANGEAITTEEKVKAEAVLSAAGSALPRSMTPEAVALVLRLGGQAAPVPHQRNATPTHATLSDRKKDVRLLIRRKVSKLSIARGVPHSHIHSEMNQHLGNKVTDAPLDSLYKRVDMLDGWLKEEE